ncbi:ABC transporter ATP-binding protein [Engelhardtia mirabilis]|uniref:Teichoic acids export ATP-binding protein TagH n=1 Tax=Engelhardtia mirabilis TaxID=2528011 RepID=A0A518BJY1_9BACT|nr:Teichoic acids export ATP-binding protein TagH [Planctomycetes bacterium Pla133]QDV01601.1 Teichoic acids export ATP-binding protein TagH [Planctomycetes bacterium Pla86]
MSETSSAVPANASSAAAASRSGSEQAIVADGVSKCYRLYQKPMHRLLDSLHIGGPRYREFWALREVYLDVRKGATVGVIGENGAGKSTLLKLLSGVSSPTTGSVQVNGRVTSLIELGAGFHPEFSGIENIGLACSILGMLPDEIAEKTPQIVEFSELGDFIHRPVKDYSSGMYVRLGFAVATCVEPDILLVDEALSVGDEHFRGKCMRRLNEFAEGGGTTLFVSHDLGAVKQMCEHVVLVHEGRVVEQGPAERVADAYLKRVKMRGNDGLSFAARAGGDYPQWGSGEIAVESVELIGPGGQAARVFSSGEQFTVQTRYRVQGAVREPVFGVGIYRSDGTYVNGSNHEWRAQPIQLTGLEPGETGTVEMIVGSLPLLQGEYYISTFLYDHGHPTPVAIDHRERVVVFQVVDELHRQHGMVTLESDWRVRRELAGGEVCELESQS